MTLAVSWMVLQPAGGAAYVERGVVTAPDRRCALATARQHYGAAVTVQSALSWRVALSSGPASLRPQVVEPAPVVEAAPASAPAPRPPLGDLIVAYLRRAGVPCPAHRIARLLGRQQQHIQRAMPRLERDGRVTRHPPEPRGDGTFFPCTWTATEVSHEQ